MADKIYYDVVATGTTNTTITFFGHDEGTDGETVTNLSEKRKLDKDFSLRRIELVPAGDITVDDAIKLTEKAVIKLIIDRKEIIKIPAVLCVTSAGITFMPDAGSTGTSTYTRLSDVLGGYEFSEPVTIPAGTEFEVKLVLDSAFGTDTNLTIVLYGSE